MKFSRDPLANPEPLIRRVYAYVAYCLGEGPDAEDVTSDVFERAVRYRDRYDRERGEPVAWLLGIARRSVAGFVEARVPTGGERTDEPAPGDLEEDAMHRLEVRSALARLDDRDRELIALRYGADLSARQMARLLDMRTNAVEVALHRALGRLREIVEREEGDAADPVVRPVRT